VAEGVRYVADWINDDSALPHGDRRTGADLHPYSGEINDAAMIVRRNLESEDSGA